jgi:octaprenyl-diphosphate synthase
MSHLDAVIKSVKHDLDLVEQKLFFNLHADEGLIRDVSSHILGSGGKRFRPLLHLLAARLCNYQGDQHITLACVLEYIHTATLLHDDVIDHAQIRRGSSSANVLWGNHTTILAGDFLLSRAFAIAVEMGNLCILRVISEAATLMVEAEANQVAHSHDPLVSEEQYLQIITKKTASLIAAASRSGAILGGVNSTKEEALSEYGLNVGIAFQIMDDVLDYSSTENDLGKTIGKDLQEGSVTLPFIEAMKRSSGQDRKIMLEMIRNGRELGAPELTTILELIKKYEGSSYAVAKAKAYAQQAADHLMEFDSSEKRTHLLALAEYVVERKN